METAVDLFAGAGGFTEGAEGAGLRVIWAANHNRLAVEFHKRNHPNTEHVCQDLHQADWSRVPRHDVLLASPSCTGHSPARGKEQPRHDAARSTAWAVVSCLEVLHTPFAIIENVPAFLKWKLYPAWKLALESLGYSVAPHIIDSADHGVPQHRVRVFFVVTRSSAPIQLDLPRREHVPVSSVLQWDRWSWSPLRKIGRSANTIQQAERGRREIGDRFAMPYYGSGSGETGRSLDRPLGTVTTHDRWALVDWSGQTPVMRMMQPAEYAAATGLRADFELPSKRTEAIHLIGNMVVPVVATDILVALREAA